MVFYSNSHIMTKMAKAALAWVCGMKCALGWTGTRPVPAVQMGHFTCRKTFSRVRKTASPAMDKLHLHTASIIQRRNSWCLFYSTFIEKPYEKVVFINSIKRETARLQKPKAFTCPYKNTDHALKRRHQVKSYQYLGYALLDIEGLQIRCVSRIASTTADSCFFFMMPSFCHLLPPLH